MANFSLVTAQLKTIWEAITPPTEPTLPYNQLPQIVIDTKDALPRQFWFQPGQSAQIELIQDFGNDSSIFETRFEGVLRLSVIGKAQDTVLIQVVDEAMLFARQANLYDWSPNLGVEEVEIALASVRGAAPFGVVDIIFQIRARTQEQ